LPRVVTPHVWLPNPVLISTNLCRPMTPTGLVAHGKTCPPHRSTRSDGNAPSWPNESSPQQYPAPLMSTPHV
jgi:hypothetical protein